MYNSRLIELKRQITLSHKQEYVILNIFNQTNLFFKNPSFISSFPPPVCAWSNKKVEKEEIVSFVPNFLHKTHATTQINFFQKIDEKFSGFCNFIRLIEAEATLVLSVQGLRSLSLFLICVLFKPHFNRKNCGL